MLTKLIPLSILLVFALAGCASITGTGAGRVTLHVSPSGDDVSGAGTRSRPFASLERARDEIRRRKSAHLYPDGGVTVSLHGGVYERSEPFVLGAEDSGSEYSPVVYQARPGENVSIVGGKTVTGFLPVTQSGVLDRLEPAARGNVQSVDLRARGIEDYGTLTERGHAQPIHPAHMELFFNGRPMTLARWPNLEDGDGYTTIVGLPDGAKAKRFSYDGDRPSRWKGETDLWVYGYWYHDWSDTYMKVKTVSVVDKTIETVNTHRYGLRKGARWYALNALSELDVPGEYYIDRDNGILYFWPPGPLESGDAVLSVTSELVVLDGASAVTVEGVTLEACRGTAVVIRGGALNRVVGCTIRNTGNKAASVSGRSSAIVGCDIYETGDGGISLQGGDRAALDPADLVAENNHIHHFNRWSRTYRPAVGVGGCGNIVRNNLIHHGSHNAIQLGGNDHLIEYNEVHSVCTDTGDVGAFYTGRDWTARGTVIRYNYWHHIAGPGRIGAMGVYLDDQASGFQIYGNVFYRVTRAMFIGGGSDNLVDNNTFVDCVPSVHIDARGLGWQKAATDAPAGELRTRLTAVPYRSPLWQSRYPNLPGILDDDPGTPKRNRVRRNLCMGGKWENIDTRTRKHQTVEGNIIDDALEIDDLERKHFLVLVNIRNGRHGFRAVPVDRIGVYRDRRRASWPVRHDHVPVAPPPSPSKPGKRPN